MIYSSLHRTKIITTHLPDPRMYRKDAFLYFSHQSLLNAVVFMLNVENIKNDLRQTYSTNFYSLLILKKGLRLILHCLWCIWNSHKFWAIISLSKCNGQWAWVKYSSQWWVISNIFKEWLILIIALDNVTIFYTFIFCIFKNSVDC